MQRHLTESNKVERENANLPLKIDVSDWAKEYLHVNGPLSAGEGAVWGRQVIVYATGSKEIFKY